MNIPLISGQIAKLHVKLETEEDFELYGGTTKAGFSITPERPETKNEWLVTIDEPEVAGKPLTRFDVYIRQLSTGREWVVLSGKILVAPRSADVAADKLAPVEYNVIIPVVENAVDLTGAAIVTGIPGPRGWSAYEIAVQEGFEGTPEEWLEHMRQQTATLAVEKVTPLMERAETAAGDAEREAAAAKTEKETAAAHAAAAKESELAAAEHQTAAAGEVTKAAAEVEKAKQERETAAGHANAAAKSAQDALAAQQGAEQAAQNAQTALTGAETAASDANTAKVEAQTAEGNAKGYANAAAADKAAAAQAKQDAQAAQTKAEQESVKAEGFAAQLGDAALKSADNTFSGANTFNNTVALNGALSGELVKKMMTLPHKYDTCKTVAEMAAIDPNYKEDLKTGLITVLPSLISGRFGDIDFQLPYMPARTDFAYVCYFKGAELHFYNPNNIPSKASDCCYFLTNAYLQKYIKRMFVILPKVTQAGWIADDLSSLEEFHCAELPECVSASEHWMGMLHKCNKLKRFDTRMPKLKNGGTWNQQNDGNEFDSANYGMCEDCSSLSIVSVGFPSLSSGRKMFASCKLNGESAVRVLDSLPEWTEGVHELTMGIHIDHQADEEVLAAIDASVARGWTVSVQWNGTATAATFALRPAPPLPVYAKIDTFTDAEGNEQPMLNWCHGVTSPDGKEPEELGYELFESVEEARAHFNLPEPEEFLTAE